MSRAAPARLSLALVATALLAPAESTIAAPPLWTDGSTDRTLVAAPSWSSLVRAVAPAVVHLTVHQAPHGDNPAMRQFYEEYFGEDASPDEEAVGSGFIVNKDGYILTNDHVVEGGAPVLVTLTDDRHFTARIVGADPETDVALLKIDAPDPLPVVRLGNSDVLAVGDAVAAIGNPFNLSETVTTGIVSAKGRGSEEIGEAEGGGDDPGRRFYDFIQTDAAINFGNSGGPLIDLHGNVVGMNTAIFTGGPSGGPGQGSGSGAPAYAQGIGFAIPVNMLKRILPILVAHGSIPRSYLGVVPQSVTAELARAMRLPRAAGAVVVAVHPASPAARGGLRVGDVVVRIEGRPVRGARDFRFSIALAGAGRRVQLTYLRHGEPHQTTVTLEPAPDTEEIIRPRAARSAGSTPAGTIPLGLSVAEITPDLAHQLHLDSTEGVVVTGVDPGSLAMTAGLSQSDIIVQIGDSPVRSLDDYDSAVKRFHRGEMVLLLVQPQDGPRRFVAFEMR